MGIVITKSLWTLVYIPRHSYVLHGISEIYPNIIINNKFSVVHVKVSKY